MKNESRVEGPGRRRLGRRAMIYLFAGIFFATIMLTLLYARTLPTSAERAESVSSRIQSMNDFITDFHKDANRAAYIAGFRALIALEQYASEEGTFLPNPETAFIEAFTNGTIDGVSYDVMENSTFGEYLQRINYEARRIDLHVDATVSSVSLAQYTPWTLLITYNLSVTVNDTRGLASWEYTQALESQVPITNLRDPTYSVSTGGRVSNAIQESPYNNTDFVSGNDTTNLNNEATFMYYRVDPHAPNFLQRLAGNLTAESKYGIASIVNLDELNAQGEDVNTSLSVIDYNYFAGAVTVNYCPGFGEPLPSWLKIDAEHYNDALHDYELDDLNASIC